MAAGAGYIPGFNRRRTKPENNPLALLAERVQSGALSQEGAIEALKQEIAAAAGAAADEAD